MSPNRVLIVLAGCLLSATAWAQEMPTNSLRVWLKADAITGLASGDTVTHWPDSSGLGFDATQLNASLRPYYLTNVAYGLPIVRFSRVGDYVWNQSYTNPVQEVTVFLVARRLGNKLGGGYQNLFIGGPLGHTTAGNNFYQLTHDWTAADIRGNFAVNNLDILNGNVIWPTNDFALIVLKKGTEGDGFSGLYYNGTLRGTGSGQMNLGSGYWLGSWNGNDANIEVAEMALYGAALPLQDHQDVEGALAVKYGLTSFLPADHPWRNGIPAPPRIETRPVAGVGLTSAFLGGYLESTGTAPVVVSVVWGTANGGSVTSGLWQATNTFALGAWAEGDSPSYQATGLESNRFYYYRYAASNAIGFTEATNVVTFMTAPIEVSASDPSGIEGEKTLAFTLSRPLTATNEGLDVAFAWSGTAGPGDFHQAHPQSNVLLQVGQTSTNIVVFPVDDPLAESEESVELSLTAGQPFVALDVTATGVIAASSSRIPTNTIGYWRFEPVPGVQADSSGNGHHIASFISDSYRQSRAASGPSSAFPGIIHDSGRSNASCMSYRALVPYAPVFTANVFTVEAFVNMTERDTNTWRLVAARWGSTAPARGWLFGVITNEDRLTFAYYADNSSYLVRAPTADFDILTNTDYFVSVAVDATRVGAGSNGVRFRLRNLTGRGPFVSACADLPAGKIQPAVDVPFEMRRFGGGTATYGIYDGLLDEVRFSAGFLPDHALMISTIDRPGTLIILR